ncbi:MAG: DUF4810 domain-containing protein [Bdellovibrionota bacterium]
MKINFLNSHRVSLNIIILSLFLAILSSCVSPTKYYWGEYENILYTQSQEPGRATPEYQIEKLQSDIQIAASKGKPLPPGFYAHLGYQYLQIGKAGDARKYFTAEKMAFPESTVLMNRFIAKLK